MFVTAGDSLYQRHAGKLDTAHVLSVYLVRLLYDSKLHLLHSRKLLGSFLSIKEPTAFIFEAPDDGDSWLLFRRYGVMTQTTTVYISTVLGTSHIIGGEVPI